MTSNKIYQLYRELRKKHGDPKDLWSQWCAEKKNQKLRELIIIGAIAVQRTSWHNADIALRNLKRANLLSLKKIAGLKSYKQLVKYMKPAGFYQTKPKRLFGIACFITQKYDSLKNFMKLDLDTAREKLLGLYGIGPETADVILLYAMDKPTFVIDEYTKRLASQRKLSKTLAYDDLKNLFEENLPRDIEIYQDFHALMIIEQRGRKVSKMEVV